ncbi:MAG: hypothetical protein M3Y53_08920 [Thermoproteota archaeon]|nr:hypothetical protein [Thermoproteota archaeon]
MVRSSAAIKKWLPLSLAGAAISLITALVFHVPIGRAIVAIALVVVLIFSGFLSDRLEEENREKQLEMKRP